MALSGSLGSSFSTAFGGSAAAGGSGQAVYASPGGVLITTYGSDSPGLTASSIGGGGGVGGTAVSGSFSGDYSGSLAMGGTGGGGGNGGVVTVENLNVSGIPASTITTYGARSYGLMAQSIDGGVWHLDVGSSHPGAGVS